MIPSRLTIADYAGQTRTIDLGPLSLIAAPNGRGKTTAIEALHLCLTARYPGAEKPPTLDDARDRGSKWSVEMADSAGGVVTWSFSGAQLAPSIVIPGRAPVKGKDATIAAIVERYGAIPTLHVRDLERLDAAGLARWIVSLCAGRAEGSSLTAAACERILAAEGATGLPPAGPRDSILLYLDTAAAAVEAQASDSRSRKRTAEMDPARKATTKAIDPEAQAAADAALAEAEATHVREIETLATLRADTRAAREAWERETQARRERWERDTNARNDALRSVETLTRELARIPAMPVPDDPGPEPTPPALAEGLPAMRDQLAMLLERTVRTEAAATAANDRIAACASGACPTCHGTIDDAGRERLEADYRAAREAFAVAGRDHDALRQKVDALAAEQRRYEVAFGKWFPASAARGHAIERNAESCGRRADLDVRIAEAQARADAASAELAALDDVPEPPAVDLSVAEAAVQAAKRAADEASVRALALRSDAEGNARILARLAEVDRQIEAERVVQERCKSVAAEVAALRSQAVGQAVGPFVAAVNERLQGALGTLVVDLAPVPRVGFVRGESFVPVARLSGMEIARWLAAAAVAAAGLAGGACQCVLVDDIDRLTETPRAALLGMLADAVDTGDMGSCVAALASESGMFDACGWHVVGL